MSEPPDGDKESRLSDSSSERPAAPVRAESGVLLFRRYEVLRELGRGGMGMVVLAHDRALDISIALKLIPDLVTRDGEAIADLRKEVLRGMALMHPGIVRTHNFEQDETGAGIVMEYVDGDTLSAVKLARPTGCCDADEVVPWLAQLCPVLDYAHSEARIVHRDLKPRNVMLTHAGRVKVADFGIAATLSDSLSRHSMEGKISGTVSYMSPQQAQGLRPTHLDDIHALGAMIYELLTGKPPFFRGNPAAIHAQVITAVPPSMMARRSELEVPASARPIPPQWERMVAACLSKDPESRPQSAGALLAGLQGETIALHSSADSRPWMRAAAGGATVAVLGTVAFLGLRSPSGVADRATDVTAVAARPMPSPPSAPTSTPTPRSSPFPEPTPQPRPTPVLTPSPKPSPTPPPPTPMPSHAVAEVAPTPTSPAPQPFNGNFVILRSTSNETTLPTPPPGVPVYRPDLTEAQFYAKYPNNSRAYGPGMWEQHLAELRAAQENIQRQPPSPIPPGYPQSSPRMPSYPGIAPSPATPPPAVAVDSGGSSAQRLATYLREIDAWLTALEVEPSMRPQADLQQLNAIVKAESAAAAKGDARSAAALLLSDAMLGAINAREAVLTRALRTQNAPGTTLGGGNNSSFFMNVVRSDWEKARAVWRTRVLQAGAQFQAAAAPPPSSASSR